MTSLDLAVSGRAVVAIRQPLLGHGLARLVEQAGVVDGVDIVGDPSDIAAGAGYRFALVRADADGTLRADVRALTLVGAADHVVAVLDGRDAPWSPTILRGADAVLHGDEGPADIAAILRLVGRGCGVVSQPALRPLRRPVVAPLPPPPALGLTPRQQDVAALLATGAPNKVVAHRLGIAEGTVKIHLSQIYRLLGVSNRGQFIARWLAREPA
ncbi:response regulator transcription factor [Azospirillum halopraeferens]|uniref:response regulator transcription factor n=1 Tax=Azospirillum halopraeferens TaxID=34010 RepID=UPI0004260CFA|nr:response regulator transcription factor [Azospirillum halopraeferens]